MRDGDGLWCVIRGYCAHLPRTSDTERGGQGSRARRRWPRHPYVTPGCGGQPPPVSRRADAFPCEAATDAPRRRWCSAASLTGWHGREVPGSREGPPRSPEGALQRHGEAHAASHAPEGRAPDAAIRQGAVPHGRRTVCHGR